MCYAGADECLQEAKSIYTSCHWPNLGKFQRAKCRQLLLDFQKRFQEHQRAKYEKRIALQKERASEVGVLGASAQVESEHDVLREGDS